MTIDLWKKAAKMTTDQKDSTLWTRLRYYCARVEINDGTLGKYLCYLDTYVSPHPICK